MKVFNETDLERYLRCPETLDEETRLAIETYVAESVIAWTILTFYSEFYREMQLGTEHAKDKIKAFIEALFPPHPIGGHAGASPPSAAEHLFPPSTPLPTSPPSQN